MTESLIQFQWLRVPLLTARRWPAAGRAFADGHYLVHWRLLGAIAQPCAFLLGVLLAALTRDVAYTSNLVTVAVLALVGVVGAALGLWATAGLGIGLLFFADNIAPGGSGPSWILRGLLPALLGFVLLGMLTVTVPLAMNGVRAMVRSAARVPQRMKTGVEAVAAAVSVGFAAWVWSNAAPLLIRPVFVWAGSSPTVDAIAPLQKNGIWLALVLALGAAGRVRLEQVGLVGYAARLSRVLSAGLAQRSRTVIPALASALMGGCAMTLLLSGLIGNAFEALVVLAFFVGLLFLRRRLQEHPPHVVGAILRVPRPARLAIGLLLAYGASSAVLSFFWVRTQSFLPVLVAACVGAGVITLLDIDRGTVAEPTRAAPVKEVP